jgi:hypothetical protein
LNTAKLALEDGPCFEYNVSIFWLLVEQLKWRVSNASRQFFFSSHASYLKLKQNAQVAIRVNYDQSFPTTIQTQG